MSESVKEPGSFSFEKWFEDCFWLVYPKKIGKAKAKVRLAKYVKSQVRSQEIMASLSLWMKSDKWAAQSGRFIPAADAWVNSESWLDTPPMAKPVAVHRSGNASRGAQEAILAASGGSDGTLPVRTVQSRLIPRPISELRNPNPEPRKEREEQPV